jgi:hypothetical protein
MVQSKSNNKKVKSSSSLKKQASPKRLIKVSSIEEEYIQMMEGENSNTSTVSTNSASNNLSNNNSVESSINDDYYFINIDFLKRWIQGDPLNDCLQLTKKSLKYQCSHFQLNPFAINYFKLVRSSGIDLFAETYNINKSDLGLMLACSKDKNTKLCHLCVYHCFNYFKYKEILKNETKLLTNLLKTMPSEENKMENSFDDECMIIDDHQNETKKKSKSYWIGKDTLKCWSQIALNKYIQLLPLNNFNDKNSNQNGNVVIF